MKKFFPLLVLTVVSVSGFAQIKAPGVKWDEAYTFDKCNSFRIEFYAKNKELMRADNYFTYYQSGGNNFMVKAVAEKNGNSASAVIDKKNEVAIQIFEMAGGKPYYNAGGFKYPAEGELKRLEIVPTSETKEILGITCKKYTYTYKKIFGEVWLCDETDLPNDLGVFRACKMAALHNTLSVQGFVLEMTTEDDKGGKTLMKTLSLRKDEKYTLDLKGVEMNTAINKVDYYKF